MSNHRQPPPGQLPGQLNIFQAADSMGAAEALRRAAAALDAAAVELDTAAGFAADVDDSDTLMSAIDRAAAIAEIFSHAAAAARTAANAARQEAQS